MSARKRETPEIGSPALQRARESFDRHAWADAYEQLSAADADVPLSPDDVERLATAAHLIGREAESADAWMRAHRAFVERGDVPRAVRCAFWLAFGAQNMGELARGGGWSARARRLLDDAGCDVVEEGYLLFPDALRHVMAGDFESGYEMFTRVAHTGDRFGDATLVTLGRMGQGRALLALGRSAEGFAHLDEVLVAVTLGEVSPIAVGTVFCSIIEACHEMFDLRRAREWTDALSRWCESQPSLMPYRGQCLVHRAEIMQLQGEWRHAMDEAQRARDCLAQPPVKRAIGAAYYQMAELYRLSGELDAADEAYRQASQFGRKPQPGLALLRMAQGQLDPAVVAIRSTLNEFGDRPSRPTLLAACVSIMLAARDIAAARDAADELAAIATRRDSPYLRALGDHANGAVLLAEGDAKGAMSALRQAWSGWQELDTPYEAARVRVLLGCCSRELGDEEAAAMEFDAARWVFRQLGAAADLAHVEALLRRRTAASHALLSGRELEVLRLVAAGRTNRAIATRLEISEKTVARHVSNIFTKLRVPTRAAATAYAYQNELV